MDTSKHSTDLLGEESLYKQLLLQAASQGQEDVLHSTAGEMQPKVHSIVPEPGFCLKTKDGDGKKVFINVCKAANLPCPREISDQELLELLDAEDPSGFRVPMSLGEPRAEVDRSASGCTAYDVVINPEFLKRMENSQVLMGFVLTVVLEGLEQKYNLALDREWKILKNKKFLGSVSEQNVRAQSKPWIMEMDGEASTLSMNQKPLISEVTSSADPERPKAPEPAYTILQEPADRHPDFLVAEIHLPKVKSAATVSVDIGEDRICLQTRSNSYSLDVFLPYNLMQEDCAAQFNKQTKILTLTMPVIPVS